MMLMPTLLMITLIRLLSDKPMYNVLLWVYKDRNSGIDQDQVQNCSCSMQGQILHHDLGYR